MTNPDPAATPDSVNGIRIRRVTIRNFRCIREIQFDLESGTTYLVGENNAGKTSILLALWSAFGSHRPREHDLRRSIDATAANEASVDVLVVPSRGKRFPPELAQRLVHVQRDASLDTEAVGIRTVFRASREGSLLATSRSFLQPERDGEWILAPAPGLPPDLMKRLDAHFLDASRDLVEEVGNRTSIWGRVLADLQIEPHPDSGEGREALERDLADLAGRVRESSPVLRTLQSDLAGIAEAQAGVGSVEVQPLPPNLEELARTAEVVLHQPEQPVLPLRQHGLGSRSLATMLVFQTLAKFRLGADSGFRPHLLTLLEEPEAHLHPQAIFALRNLLDRLPGQRLVSTHSSQLIAEADPRSVRLIRRAGESIRILGLPSGTARHIAQFRRFVERPFGEIIFARAVVLCDGSTERCVLPILLSKYFDGNPAGLGVSFIDCESMNGKQCQTIVDTAHDLGLTWLLFADNDNAGKLAVESVVHPATREGLTTGSWEVVMSGRKQIEQLLIDAGYGKEIEQVAQDNDTEIGTDSKAHLRFLKNNKPWAAEQVAIRAMEAGKPRPTSVDTLAQKLETGLGIRGDST